MKTNLSFWRQVFEPQPDIKRLYLLNKAEEREHHLYRLQRKRESRLAVHHALKTCAENGKVAVIVTSRDCDMCVATERRVVSASIHELDQFLDRLYDGAEGPVSWHIQAPSDPFEYSFRDLAAEAYEDGHAHVVYA